MRIPPNLKVSSKPAPETETRDQEPVLPSVTAMLKPRQALSFIGRNVPAATTQRAANVASVLTGQATLRFAAIDLGSSSAKMLVLEKTTGGWKTLLDRKIGCALGKGVDAGEAIPSENIARATAALKELAADAEALGVSAGSIPVITTAVVRNSSNGKEVTEAFEAASGLDIRILSGEEEAQMGFRGALTMLHGAPGRYATLDLGGGSFQLAVGTEAGLEQGASTQIGSNYVLETLLPNELLGAADFAAADTALLTAGPMPLDTDALSGRTLVATGGVSKFLRAHFGRDVITADEIDTLRRDMGALSYDGRMAPITAGKDDDTQVALGVETDKGARDYGIKIVASTTLLLHILRGIGVSEVRVSETDARHALIDAAVSK